MGVYGLAIRRASRNGRGSATPGGGMAEPRPQRVVMHGRQDVCRRYWPVLLGSCPSTQRPDREQEKRTDRAWLAILRVPVGQPGSPTVCVVFRSTEPKVRPDPPQFGPIVAPVINNQRRSRIRIQIADPAELFRLFRLHSVDRNNKFITRHGEHDGNEMRPTIRVDGSQYSEH